MLDDGAYSIQPADSPGWTLSPATRLEMMASAAGKFLIREVDHPETEKSLPY